MDQRILILTAELMQIRKDLAKANEVKTELEKKKKQKSYELWNTMDAENIQSFKHEEFGTVFRSHKVWCKIIDTDKAYKYLRERGVYDDIMKIEPRSGRLNTLIKEEYIKKSGVVPEGEIGIQVTLSPMIGNRQAKGGGEVERPEGL